MKITSQSVSCKCGNKTCHWQKHQHNILYYIKRQIDTKRFSGWTDLEFYGILSTQMVAI